jgi:hypothetical protein
LAISYGILAVFDNTFDREFTKDDQLFGALAQQANCHSQRRLVDRAFSARQAETLREVSTTISAGLGEKEVAIDILAKEGYRISQSDHSAD